MRMTRTLLVAVGAAVCVAGSEATGAVAAQDVLHEGFDAPSDVTAIWASHSPLDALRQVVDLKPKELLQRRYDRVQAYGRFTDTKDR